MATNTQTFKKTMIAAAVSQALLLAATQVSAASITVNSTADASVADGNCTLREAIQAANTDSAVDSCATGSGADTIDFDNTLSGSTITLGGTEIDISSDLTIDGDINDDGSPDITLDGANTSSIFELTAAGTETIQLEGLTLQNGNDDGTTGWTGGAIVGYYGSNTLDLTISNSVITSNTAYNGAAIAFKGDLTITNSTISNNNTHGNGGGIYLHQNPSFNTLTIEGSTFDNNTSSNYNGGAIWAHSTTLSFTISSSTFSNNTAKGFGGAVLVYGSGDPVDLEITNSTFSENTATDYSGGAIKANEGAGTITITNSTFVGNNANYRSGIDISGSPVITNSIFANNNGDCRAGGSATMTNTLVKDGSMSCGTPSLTGDPDLGVLADNGGPTLTHLPNETSPVIDAGDNTDCGSGKTITTDQRGEPRDDGSCDIGAVEVQAPEPEAPEPVVVTAGSASTTLYLLFSMIPFLRVRLRRKT